MSPSSWGATPASAEVTAQARLRRSTDQSGGVVNTPQTINWTTQLEGASDADGAAWDVGLPNRATAKVAGVYLATWQLQQATALYGRLDHFDNFGISVQEGKFSAPAGNLNICIGGCALLAMQAGDYVQLVGIAQDAGSFQGPGSGGNPVGSELTLTRIG